MSTVLALDVATRTGWCAGLPCTRPVFGSFRLDAPREGGRFMQLGRRVNEMIREHEVAEVVFETPHVGRSNPAILLPLFGYRAAVMMAAEAKGLPYTSVAPATWRKDFLGHGRLKRAAAKAACIERCRWLGHEPRNDDEADALALWHCRCSIISSGHLTMLMRRGSFGSIGEDHEAQDHSTLAPTSGRKSRARRVPGSAVRGHPEGD